MNDTNERLQRIAALIREIQTGPGFHTTEGALATEVLRLAPDLWPRDFNPQDRQREVRVVLSKLGVGRGVDQRTPRDLHPHAEPLSAERAKEVADWQTHQNGAPLSIGDIQAHSISGAALSFHGMITTRERHHAVAREQCQNSGLEPRSERTQGSGAAFSTDALPADRAKSIADEQAKNSGFSHPRSMESTFEEYDDDETKEFADLVRRLSLVQDAGDKDVAAAHQAMIEKSLPIASGKTRRGAVGLLEMLRSAVMSAENACGVRG
jgi:hypothetical protein